jgi:hypothetical protein
VRVRRRRAGLVVFVLASVGASAALPPRSKHQPNTWVKLSPVPGGPPSPGMAYEASLGYDPVHRMVIRFGGHNQSGGGEQNAETWVFDPRTAQWTLKEPNTSPPGACCNQQNVFDEDQGRFVRFRAASGNHGWHWFRQNYLENSQVWNYDLGTNTWRDMRPVPGPMTYLERAAAWDSDNQVIVIFGGEGSQEGTVVYDPYANSLVRMQPPREPAPRSGGNMAYDPRLKLHILFGTQFKEDPHTWGYSLAENRWRDMAPAVQPPTDRNDPVLGYDRASKVVLAVVRVVDKSGDDDEVQAGHNETWAYDGAANTWRPMKPPQEPPAWGDRRRVMAFMPDLGLFLLENYVNPGQRVPGVEREQQIWAYRYADARTDPGPSAPTHLTVSTTADAATLRWDASPSSVGGYAVYRGEGAQPWSAGYRLIGETAGTSWRDRAATRGTVYHYFVRARGAGGRSADSTKVRAQPRIVEDAVVSVMSAREVRLDWQPPAGADVVGYTIERAPVEVLSEDQIVRLKKDTAPLSPPSVGAVRAIGSFVRLTKEPVRATTFTDAGVDLGHPARVEGEPLFTTRLRAEQLDAAGTPYRFGVFAYRVRAVNVLGVESGASPYFLTIPSAPQRLFSKEDGDRCKLRWQANPERALRGYRVYRMDGPRINGPGQPVRRLFTDPVGATELVDGAAGKDGSKRYWVVAVDALGQEGLPSAPTWHYREWRRAYQPFTSEWHQ